MHGFVMCLMREGGCAQSHATFCVVCTWCGCGCSVYMVCVCVCVCVDVHEGKLLAHEVMLCGMCVHLVCAYVMCCARLVSVYVY